MPDIHVVEEGLSRIIGGGSIVYAAITDEFRRILRADLRRANSLADILLAARRAIEAFEPIVAQSITDTEIAAWVLASSGVAAEVPTDVLAQLAGRFPGELSEPTRFPAIGAKHSVIAKMIAGGAPEPIIRFPALEIAAADLLDRQIVTRPEFDAMSAEARSRAFTVAHVAATEALQAVRDAVIESVQDGGTLRDFRKAADATIRESALSANHVETVFRVNVQTAYSIGQQAIVGNPVVRPIFPYARIDAIHDSRVRPDHLALETMGLDGTNIFRSDDPIWVVITPPWNFNCRCGKTFMTVRQAARRGVQEAIAWLESGNPPVSPQWIGAIIPPPASGFRGPGVRLHLPSAA